MARGSAGKTGRDQIMEDEADKLGFLSLRWFMYKHFEVFLYFREKQINHAL